MAVTCKGASLSLTSTVVITGILLTGCMPVKDMRNVLSKNPETYATPEPGAAPVEATKSTQSSSTDSKSLQEIEVYGGERSPIIEGLIARRSLISNGSAFDRVARAVLASDARTAESELRAARLRSRAEQFNWLPKIGPSISLTSLSDFVAGLVVEQVLFDNGRLKAERDFAAHDVEAAAVGLSQATNDRVSAALKLYIGAEKARHEKRVSQKSRSKMAYFVNIIQQRVDGGVSNLADLRVAEAKLHELDADLARAREAELTAMAELNAMAQTDMSGVSGLNAVSPTSTGRNTPLNVLMARAEGNRDVSEAHMRRAGLLPSVTAGGTVGDGNTNIGVSVGGDSLVGVGTGAALEAVNASKDAARRRVQQAEEDTRRVVQRLEQRRIALRRQQTESQALVGDARRTYELFNEQFENSGRPIMEVVNIFENAVRLERDSVRLQYELMDIEIDMSAMYGNLVDGGNV